jgi:hypothetical protein
MSRLVILALVAGLAGCSKSDERGPAKTAAAAARPTRAASTLDPPVAKAPPRETRPPQPAAANREVETYLRNPPPAVTAPELFKAFQKDASAEDRFKDRIIWLTGQVLRSARTPLGAPYVELAPGEGETGVVRCHFEKGHALAVMALKENQQVTIEGEVAGKGSNLVRLNDCRVLDPGLVQAVQDAMQRRKAERPATP